MRNTAQDEKWASKLAAKDKQSLLDTVASTQRWLDSKDSYSTEEYESKQKEAESVCGPILAAAYRAAPDASGDAQMDDVDGSKSSSSGSASMADDLD